MDSFLASPLFPLVMMIPVFYMFILRPRQKEMKALELLIKGLKKGDKVVTQAGIIGEVSNLTDDQITVDSGSSKIVLTRASVIKVLGVEAK